MKTSTVGDSAAILTVASSLGLTARAASRSRQHLFLNGPTAAARWAYSLRPLGILLPVAASLFVQGRFIAGTDKNPGQKMGLTAVNIGMAGAFGSVFNFWAHEKMGQGMNPMGIRIFLGIAFGAFTLLGGLMTAYSSIDN